VSIEIVCKKCNTVIGEMATFNGKLSGYCGKCGQEVEYYFTTTPDNNRFEEDEDVIFLFEES